MMTDGAFKTNKILNKMKLKLLTSVLSIFLIVSWQSNPIEINNTLANSISQKVVNTEDNFLGNWYNCNTSEWECFIKMDGEKYVFKSKSAEKVFSKKNNTLLEAEGGLTTIKFDKTSNHLILKENGSSKEFCKAHGNDADANDKTSRENSTNYSDRIGEKPSNTKIGNLEVMNKDLSDSYKWYQAKDAVAALGKGWRLPTKEELHTIYLNRAKIGGFCRQSYWSSFEENTVRTYKDGAGKQQTYKTAWAVPFGQRDNFNKEGFSNQESFLCVRAVRTN